MRVSAIFLHELYRVHAGHSFVVPMLPKFLHVSLSSFDGDSCGRASQSFVSIMNLATLLETVKNCLYEKSFRKHNIAKSDISSWRSMCVGFCGIVFYRQKRKGLVLSVMCFVCTVKHRGLVSWAKCLFV